MRNDRDYPNNRYNDTNRDRERNYQSYDDWSYHSGYNTDDQEAYRGYNRNAGRGSEYDPTTARQSRGLEHNQRYSGSQNQQAYPPSNKYNSTFRREQNSYRDNRDTEPRRQPVNRDEYRNEQDFSRSNGGDFDRGRGYGRYNQENRSSEFYRDNSRSNSDSDRNYTSPAGRDRYDRDDTYMYDRREYGWHDSNTGNRGTEQERPYDRNKYENRRHDYRRNDGFYSNQRSHRQEPPSIKDKYSSSSLHYSGPTSMGGNEEPNRGRYEGSQYIGSQSSDRNFAGSGLGSSQRNRHE